MFCEMKILKRNTKNSYFYGNATFSVKHKTLVSERYTFLSGTHKFGVLYKRMQSFFLGNVKILQENAGFLDITQNF